MNFIFPVIIGNFSEQKSIYLKTKLSGRLPSDAMPRVKTLQSSKFKECIARAVANSNLSSDYESEFFGHYVETVFCLSSSHPLYERLQSSGFRVISSDSLLRNYEGAFKRGFKKVLQTVSSTRQKEKLRRRSHASFTF